MKPSNIKEVNENHKKLNEIHKASKLQSQYSNPCIPILQLGSKRAVDINKQTNK